jgi:chemotaxis signal transduction protein
MLEFVDKEKYEITPDEATWMIMGILVDTNSFMFHTTFRTFNVLSKLQRFGGEMGKVQKYLRENKEEYTKKVSILNSLEIIEFMLCNNYYGVSTSLINEILAYQSVTPIPNAHSCVEGIFMPRNKMITAIDLGGCLQIGTANSNGFFVVAQVDDTEVAFHIDSVVGIHKVEKEEIRDMGHFVPKDGYTDGAIRINKKLVILLNFENIVRDVNPEELTMQLEEDKIKEVFDE